MSELQFEFGSKEPLEATKWAILQARVSPDEKTEIFLSCKAIGLTYSVITRIMWRKLVSNFRAYPNGINRNDPTKEIDNAVGEVETYLPVIIRQKKIAPRMF